MSHNNAKVVLITGSEQGIGAETARLFAKNGYKIMIHGINGSKVNSMIDECQRMSPQNHKMYGAVLNFEDPENGGLLVDKTIEVFGKLDVLICNAGIFGTTNADNVSECWDVVCKMMNINIMAHIKACLHATKHLKKASGGANIILIGAAAYLKPVKDMFFYAVYGSAIVSLARALAAQLAPLIRVNAVTVGPAKTPIWEDNSFNVSDYNHVTLLQRLAEPEEIANTIFFVASNNASFVTGSNLLIDGGYCANAVFEPKSKQEDISTRNN